MTVGGLVDAIRRGGGEVAISTDGRALIGRNIPQPLHDAIRVRGNRDKVLHFLRVREMLKDKGPPGADEWAPLVVHAENVQIEIGRYVVSPWTGQPITVTAYLEQYSVADRRPS